MRKICCVGLVALVAVLVCGAAVAASLSPTEVVVRSTHYNGQEITVSGAVEDFRAAISHRGNAYETFKLCDSKKCLDVFAWGSTPRTDGAQVALSGRFWEIKHVGRYTFYNELDLDNSD